MLLDGFEEAVDEAIVQFLICGLVHKSGTDTVKGTDRASHKESGQNTGRKHSERIFPFPSSQFCDITLADVVAAHLGCI